MGIPVSIDKGQYRCGMELLKTILATLSMGVEGHADDPLFVTCDSPDLTRAVERVADALERLTLPPETSGFHFEGAFFMRTFPQDRPADVIPFSARKVVDSEGAEVDPQPDLTYSFSSDKPDIVTILDNGDGTVTVNYNSAKKLEDNSYDIAEIRAESNDVSLPDGGVIKDVVTEQIQLVPGAAAGFGGGGGFQFPDA